jgi:hypothetical protein
MSAQGEIPMAEVEAALGLLSNLAPPVLSMYWEYQDGATSVLFEVRVEDQPESAVEQTYFGQVVPGLSELIPAGDDPMRWMVVFQDSTGHLITSCSAADGSAPSNKSFKPNPLRGPA